MNSAFGSGVVSSFFTYRDFWAEGLTSSSNWNEIDFEWLGIYDDKVQTNLIIQNEWDLPDLIDLNVNPHDDFHVYAIEWTPNSIKFFIDAQLIRIYYLYMLIMTGLNIMRMYQTLGMLELIMILFCCGQITLIIMMHQDGIRLTILGMETMLILSIQMSCLNTDT